MKITVCQLHDDPVRFENEWQLLAAHVKANQSDLVLLPEMPFSPWLSETQSVDVEAWNQAVVLHDQWMERLPELGARFILGSRPVNQGDRRLNLGFVWDGNFWGFHAKYYLPNEPGFWEATWYDRGVKEFPVLQCGDLRVGFMICTELWFTEHARRYGKDGAHLIVNPRVTEYATVDKWLACGRTVSVVSGAYSASSNRYGEHPGGKVHFGGHGWVTGPNSEILVTTSDDAPFATVTIDLAYAESAKHTYPRDVLE